MSNEAPVLSVYLIVLNEEQHLQRLLTAVRQFADEVIVLDTGSTDDTVGIAQRNGAIVNHFNWCDDFAKARNAAMELCSGQYLMWLDADDIISDDSIANIKKLFSCEIDWDVLYLPYYYSYSPQSGKRGKRKMPPRIWRNGLGIKWIHPIHEHPLYPGRVRKERSVKDIEVLHNPLGDSSQKSDRNMRIMMNALQSDEYRDSDYILWHVAKEHSQLGNARQAAAYFRRAIDNADRKNRFHMARLYYGLARQYRAMEAWGDCLEAAAYSAIAYGQWREPYLELAEVAANCGESTICQALLELAGSIPMHDRQVERVQLYQQEPFERFAASLLEQASASIATTTAQGRPVNLVAGGDVCLARQLPGYVERNGDDWPFAGIREYLREADISMVNLESVTSTLGDFLDKGAKRPFYYRNRPEMIDVLVNAGIDVVSVANNHVGDYGIEALVQQTELLDSCRILHFGAGQDCWEAATPRYCRAGDLVVAFIGVETDTPSMAAHGGSAGVNYCREEHLVQRLAPAILLARRSADVVIVSPHWGRNWAERPSSLRRRVARRVIELGADAILGHSAHILQGVEVHQGCPIVYDMGTLLFDRVNENRMKVSALFELKLSDRGVRALLIKPIWLYPGQARFASEIQGGMIRRLMMKLSTALEPGIEFHRSGEMLELPLAGRRSALGLKSVSPPAMDISVAGTGRKVAQYYRELASSAEYKTVPGSALFTEPVWVNEWLQVLGARAARQVHPGYGFVCEVFLLPDAPPPGRWEARLTGWMHGEQKFSYTHPVAEGVAPVARWNGNRIFGDRMVVRPPADLQEGVYQLYWHLFEREEKRRMLCTGKHERLRQKMVFIGELRVDAASPRKVAMTD